nr:unnamed protein product [Callosobruchus analis]
MFFANAETEHDNRVEDKLEYFEIQYENAKQFHARSHHHQGISAAKAAESKGRQRRKSRRKVTMTWALACLTCHLFPVLSQSAKKELLYFLIDRTVSQYNDGVSSLMVSFSK